MPDTGINLIGRNEILAGFSQFSLAEQNGCAVRFLLTHGSNPGLGLDKIILQNSQPTQPGLSLNTARIPAQAIVITIRRFAELFYLLISAPRRNQQVTG